MDPFVVAGFFIRWALRKALLQAARDNFNFITTGTIKCGTPATSGAKAQRQLLSDALKQRHFWHDDAAAILVHFLDSQQFERGCITQHNIVGI